LIDRSCDVGEHACPNHLVASPPIAKDRSSPVAGEPRDYHAGWTGSREGSWKRRRLNTFQLFGHTGSFHRLPILRAHRSQREIRGIPNQFP